MNLLPGASQNFVHRTVFPFVPSNDPSAGNTTPPRSPPPRRTRRRWWLALFLTVAGSVFYYPPAWHGMLRLWLAHEAGKAGCEITLARIEGGLLDTTSIYGLRCRQRSLPATPVSPSAARAAAGTDFRVARLDGTFAWRKIFTRRAAATWVGDLVVEGISGRLDLTTARSSIKPVPAVTEKKDWHAAGVFPDALLASLLATISERLPSFSDKLVPTRFRMACDDLMVRRGRFTLHCSGGLLTGARDEAGQFTAREIAVGGPGYQNVLNDRHAQTYWKGSQLTFVNLELRPTVVLRDLALDGAHLSRRKLDWQGSLNALGGTVRGQGSLDFSRRRLGLDIGGTLAGVQVRPLAKTLGIGGATGGQVVQSSFTFRGDLEDWLAGEMWLNGSVTDFHWGQRRWESLDVRAIVINRHVQVHQLDLRQSGNYLSFNGECVLPAATKGDGGVLVPAELPEDWWRQTPFSCNIDARLNELQALSDLIDPTQPLLRGRMSANGTITARGTRAQGFDGYLNVEGSELSVRGAPLDYLHSTLFFRGGEMRVADLQATRAGDYFYGKGKFDLLGPWRYEGELHAAVKDMATYAPAYRGVLPPQPISGALDLDWIGHGGETAGHEGEFRAVMKQFFTSAGGGAMPRPVNLEAAGSYSPSSVKVQRLTLVDGEGKARHDAIRVEGEIPWTEDPRRWAAGQWLDLTRPMDVRAECQDAPLDVLAALAPAFIHAARGRISGSLEARDAWRAPVLNGALQIKDADFLWTDTARTPLENVGGTLRLDQSVVQFDRCEGKVGGNPFSVKGRIDLHDTTRPALDIELAGQETLRAEEGQFSARADYTLRVRSEREVPPLLSGEVRLSEGWVRRRVELKEGTFPDELDAAPRGLLAAFTDALPAGLAAARLDLHVTSGDNLKLDGITAQGILAVDLRLGGSWHDPTLTGSLSVEGGKIFLPETEMTLARGTLLFDDSRPVDDPLIAIKATGTPLAGGETGSVYFFGSHSEGVSRTNTLDTGSAVSALLSVDQSATVPAVPAQDLFAPTQQPFAPAEAPLWPQALYLRLR